MKTVPRFSIVIPVRDRAQTLPYTLQTCLAQEFTDCEIIVSDNCSSDGPLEIAAGFADERIKYIRTPRPLAMCDSWEFAVAHAMGEYVIVVGADDGLLLHALGEIDRLLRMLDAKILRWESACYNWPDLPIQEHAPAHALLIPLKQANDFYPVHLRDSDTMIEPAANARISYTELPMVQCAAIHRSLFEQLRAQTGRVFRSRCPDVYSSFAFAAIAGSYYSVAAPMTINGLSGGSNGVACIYLKERSPIADEFSRFNTVANHTHHALVPNVPVISAYVADSFLHIPEALIADPSKMLERRQLIVHCIAEGRFANEGEWLGFKTSLRCSLEGDVDLLRWFDVEYSQRLLADLTQTRHQLKRYGGAYQYLDASEFGVTNIFEAAQLVEKILGCKRDGINAHIVPEPSTGKPPPTTAAGTSAGASARNEDAVARLQWVEVALSDILSSAVPTRWMIDVGAHHGTSLEPYLRAGWKACAFEPVEANRRKLASAFPNRDQLTIRPEAVSNETGTKAFHLALNLDGSLHEYHHSLEQTCEDAWHKKGPTVTVETVRLDDLVARGELPDHIGFLKVDTEGHDLAVLHSAARLRCDVISVEFWSDGHALGKSPSPARAMIDLLRGRGFEAYMTICHDGDATAVFYNSLDGVRPDSWGNIVFFHKAVEDLFRRVITHRHWQLVLEMSRGCDDLRTQLRAKEAVIRELDASVKMFAGAAEERLQLIQRLHQPSEPAPPKRRLAARLATAAGKLFGR